MNIFSKIIISIIAIQLSFLSTCEHCICVQEAPLRAVLPDLSLCKIGVRIVSALNGNELFKEAFHPLVQPLCFTVDDEQFSTKLTLAEIMHNSARQVDDLWITLDGNKELIYQKNQPCGEMLFQLYKKPPVNIKSKHESDRFTVSYDKDGPFTTPRRTRAMNCYKMEDYSKPRGENFNNPEFQNPEELVLVQKIDPSLSHSYREIIFLKGDYDEEIYPHIFIESPEVKRQLDKWLKDGTLEVILRTLDFDSYTYFEVGDKIILLDVGMQDIPEEWKNIDILEISRGALESFIRRQLSKYWLTQTRYSHKEIAKLETIIAAIEQRKNDDELPDLLCRLKQHFIDVRFSDYDDSDPDSD